MSLSQLIEHSTRQLKTVSSSSINAIQNITQQARMLAMNALIEAAHAGSSGAGFSSVATEVKSVADEIELLAVALKSGLEQRVDDLRAAVANFIAEERSQRLIDLALNAVEIVDRNLYERTCDVRWWATETALVNCLMAPSADAKALTTERLAVILSSYTVYLDLWLCDLQGNVVANGRPERFDVKDVNVCTTAWFRDALDLDSGEHYAVADISRSDHLHGAQVATYAAQVRENGTASGRVLGVLGIHFDWAPQADTVVKGIRIGSGDNANSRVLLLDAERRVIAASDGIGLLKERFALESAGKNSGAYIDREGRLVAFHVTPGYETYRGLGWSGVIVQKDT